VFVIEQKKACFVGWPAPGLLLLVREDGTFAFHDTATRAERFTFAGRKGYIDPTMALSGDGRWLVARQAVWGLERTVAALTAGRARVPKPVKAYECPDEYMVHSLYDLAPDGPLALRCVAKDLMTPLVQHLLSLPGFNVQGVCPGPGPSLPYAAALSTRFVVWYEKRMPPYKQARVYSLQSGKQVTTLTHARGINKVVFSRDGRLLATAASGTVCVWSPESGDVVRKFKALRGNVQAFAFHPSGRSLAVSCLDETIRFWDIECGKETGSYAWGVGPATRLAFSPDGSTVAACSDRAVVVWDVEG
jgi:hypothetical protein